MPVFTNILKYVFMAVNFLVMILGVLLIAVGAYTLTISYYYKDFVDHGFFSVPALIIFVGSVITFIFFLGFFGIVKKSHHMTIAFAVLMSILLVMIFGSAIAAYTLQGTIDDSLHKRLNESLANYKNDNKTKEIWDSMQINLECCGVNGPSDYTNMTVAIPTSCCKANVDCTATNPDAIYKDSCFTRIEDYVHYAATLLFRSCLITVIIQLFWVIGSCYLSRQFSDSYEQV